VQFLYAAPFVLLSLISFVGCLAIPRLRQHALPALVAPVAFGVCSILTFVTIIVAANIITDHFHVDVSPGPLVGIKGILIGVSFYFIPGIVGAWIAVYLTNKFKRRFL
jgi:hypothetical protein